jgi:tetratricopeptide (TPR) repeat protein
MEALRCRIVRIALLLWVLFSGKLAAQTSGPSADHSIDHTAACGLFQLGKEFGRALEHCDRALQDDPDDHSTLLNRGSAHLAPGNLEEALSDFDRAIKMKPEDARNYFNRALVLRRKERPPSRDRRLHRGDQGYAEPCHRLQQQGCRTRKNG